MKFYWLQIFLAFRFDKVIFMALFALIGTSFIQATPVEMSKPERRIVDRLNCSSLTGDEIIIENTEYLAVEPVCHIKAITIVLSNIKFPSSPQALQITGKYVFLTNNVFSGKRQDNYIVGENIMLDGNVFEGELQIQEVAGINIHLRNNSYRSNLLVFQIQGISTLIQGTKSSSDYLVIENFYGPTETTKKYILNLFNVTEAIQNYVQFRQLEENSTYIIDEPNYPKSLQNRAEFEREVLTNSKINRVGSTVPSLFTELIHKSDRSYVNSS